VVRRIPRTSCLLSFLTNELTTLSGHSSGIGPTCRASATRCRSQSLLWRLPIGISRPVSTAALMTPGWRALPFPSLLRERATSFVPPLFASVFSAHTMTGLLSSSILALSAIASTLPTLTTATEIGATTSSASPTAATSSTRSSGAERMIQRVGSSSLQTFISGGTRMNAPNLALPNFSGCHAGCCRPPILQAPAFPFRIRCARTGGSNNV